MGLFLPYVPVYLYLRYKSRKDIQLAGSSQQGAVQGLVFTLCTVPVYLYLRYKSRKDIQLAGSSHQGAVQGLVFTACGRYLLSLGADRRIRKVG